MSAYREPHRPMPTKGGPNRTAAWLVALVVLLAVVAGVLGFVVLAHGGPDGTGDVPSASSSSSASASAPTTTSAASSSASASASPDVLAELGVPADLLPAGSVIEIAVDGVRLREEPSTDARIVATMRAGDLAAIADRVDAGPVLANGYDWYMVEYADGDDVWPWQDVAPDNYRYGWMASGTDDVRFATVHDVTCPEEPVDLQTLAQEVTAWERLVCLRDTRIHVEGTYGCDACGGYTTGKPTWLISESQHAPIAGRFMYYPFIRVATVPNATDPEDRDIVRATLHVDDPASSGCVFTPDPDAVPGSYDPDAVRTWCRERLVLDSFEVIGHDDFNAVP